jgi:hypothetical protein
MRGDFRRGGEQQKKESRSRSEAFPSRLLAVGRDPNAGVARLASVPHVV